MEIRHPYPNETEQLMDIWKICFGDEDEYIRFYFSNAYQSRYTLVCVDGETIAAMMTFLPCLLSTSRRIEKGSYIYAVATRPEYRKQGLMTRMQKQAEEICRKRGDRFMTLVPASPFLFSMYEKTGYRVWTELAYESIRTEDWKKQSLRTSLQEVSDSYFIKLRQLYLSRLSCSVMLDGYMQEYAAKELNQANCRVLSVQNQYGQGYFVYYKEDGLVMIREIGMPRECFDAAVCTIAEYLDTDRIDLKLNSALAHDSAEIRPYSMVLWLDEQQPDLSGRPVYMNLMLD